MRRIWSAAAVVPLVLLGAGTAAADGTDQGPPGSSGAVERQEVVFAFAYPDAEAGLVALGGPPPEEGCFGQGFDDLGTNQVVTTGSGAGLVLGKDGAQPMHVSAATSIEDVCGRLAAGEPVELLASGVVRIVATDTYREVSGTQTTTFQNTAVGRLQTPDGESCAFRAKAHGQIDLDEDQCLALRVDVALRC